MNKELIAKAKAAKSAEELLELAKANNVEMTAEEAKEIFAQLNAKGSVSDDELDAVAGGLCVVDDLKKLWDNREGIKKALSNKSDENK